MSTTVVALSVACAILGLSLVIVLQALSAVATRVKSIELDKRELTKQVQEEAAKMTALLSAFAPNAPTAQGFVSMADVRNLFGEAKQRIQDMIGRPNRIEDIDARLKEIEGQLAQLSKLSTLVSNYISGNQDAITGINKQIEELRQATQATVTGVAEKFSAALNQLASDIPPKVGPAATGQ